MSPKPIVNLLFAAAVIAPAMAEPSTTYFDRRAEGWFWYEDPPREVEREPLEAPEDSSDPDAASSPVEALEDLKARLEHALAAALMEPTEANLRAYMVLDQAARNRARRFADTWQRVVWSTPAYAPPPLRSGAFTDVDGAVKLVVATVDGVLDVWGGADDVAAATLEASTAPLEFACSLTVDELKLAATLRGHVSKVNALAMDGGRLVSGDGAGRVRRWQLDIHADEGGVESTHGTGSARR